jgi:hypothetical protein
VNMLGICIIWLALSILTLGYGMFEEYYVTPKVEEVIEYLLV